MTVKYQCPKCSRRWTEAGAERVGFRCPVDQWCHKDGSSDIELIPVNQIEDKPTRRTPLRRTARRVAAPAAAIEDEKLDDKDDVDDDEEVEDDEEIEGETEETETADDDDALTVSADDGDDDDDDEEKESAGEGEEELELDVSVADLSFGGINPPIRNDGLNNDDDWSG
ncbi:MAG: hypothetical protein KJ052_19220 [Candidatus Hydrogenedentes bacterium]|nr:hypothetical protein [Candidatus Hydrogenedentota bacterium]